MSPLNETPFKKYFDETLERCGFDKDLKSGIIFFLGESIISANTNQLMNMFTDEQKIHQEFQHLFSLYTVPSNAYSPIEELNTDNIKKLIYTYNEVYVNYIREKKFTFEDKINDELVTKLDNNFVEKFKNSEYKLITNQKLNTYFFRRIGEYLNSFDLSFNDIYIAGIKYYEKKQKIDFEGVNVLNLNIIDSFSPLYSTLFHYPLLYVYYPNNLNANHLFSSILQFLYIHTNTDIAKHIHAFHNHIFYKPNSINVRDEWEFEDGNRGVLISQTVHNALDIRKSAISKNRPDFLISDNYLLKEIKDQYISQDNFKALITHIIEDYYETSIDEVVNGKLNHAEFLQLLAIIFYETAANAMIVKDWIKSA